MKLVLRPHGTVLDQPESRSLRDDKQKSNAVDKTVHHHGVAVIVRLAGSAMKEVSMVSNSVEVGSVMCCERGERRLFAAQREMESFVRAIREVFQGVNPAQAAEHWIEALEDMEDPLIDASGYWRRVKIEAVRRVARDRCAAQGEDSCCRGKRWME